MIGNDIVDLAQAKQDSNWRRRGYVDKLFTAHEQDLIYQANDPDRLVWLLWSMKESAYKAASRQTQTRVFAPKKIACDLTVLTPDLAEGIVFYGVFYRTRSVLTPRYISTVAIDLASQKTYNPIVIDFSSTDYQLQQQQIREQVRQHSAARYGMCAQEIQIQKDSIGAPLLTIGKSISLPLSLSHHGRYGAFVL